MVGVLGIPEGEAMTPLIAINIPVLIAGYVTGEYREILFLVSILGIIFWTVLLTIKKLNGADYIWLSLISLSFSAFVSGIIRETTLIVWWAYSAYRRAKR